MVTEVTARRSRERSAGRPPTRLLETEMSPAHAYLCPRAARDAMLIEDQFTLLWQC